MACIINIETSTKVCSLSLANNDEILFDRVDFENASHARSLGLFAHEAIEYARQKALIIDAVAVSSGPGSYTGLRIGVSEAKGLCYGLDVPLIAIPTLKIMAGSVSCNEALLCPMIDARRMEVYTALYNNELTEVLPVHAAIIDENSFGDYLEKGRIAFFGDGSDKCKSVITSPNALFIEDIHPLASSMTSLSFQAFKNKEFVDTAYFEPFYLKEFQATVAKNKVIK